MINSNQQVTNINRLEQVGFVVSDIDKSIEAMWNIFGIGPWNIYVHEPTSENETSYHGKVVPCGYRLARTQNKIGGFEIELIEPTKGNSVYQDFLNDHGEGIHHLGWHKVDSLEAFNETTRMMEKAGFPCIGSSRSPWGAIAYFDTTKVLKTIVEVMWNNTAANSSPRPSEVFPK